VVSDFSMVYRFLVFSAVSTAPRFLVSVVPYFPSGFYRFCVFPPVFYRFTKFSSGSYRFKGFCRLPFGRFKAVEISAVGRPLAQKRWKPLAH